MLLGDFNMLVWAREIRKMNGGMRGVYMGFVSSMMQERNFFFLSAVSMGTCTFQPLHMCCCGEVVGEGTRGW